MTSPSAVQNVVVGLGGPAGARHAADGVDDDAGGLDQPGPQQRGQGQGRGRRVAARPGDEARRRARSVAEQLGQAVDGLGQQLGDGVLLAVPLGVEGGVGQPEVGGQVDDVADPPAELGHDGLAGAVGQAAEGQVEPVDGVGSPGSKTRSP